MSKTKKGKPRRIITLCNFEWAHWLAISAFVVLGILVMVLPSIIVHKTIWETIIVGFLVLAFGLFCVIDQIVFMSRIKKWEKTSSNDENK